MRDTTTAYKVNITNTKMKSGSTREDLLYREQITIQIPVLNESTPGFKFVKEYFNGYDMLTMVEKTADSGIALTTQKYQRPNETLEFLFFWRNRERIIQFFDDFCDAFSADYFAVDADRLNIIGIMVAVVATVFIIYFGAIFVPCIVVMFRLRNRMILLYKHVSKDVVGKLYHSLKKKGTSKKTEPTGLTPVQFKIIAT
jgi:hypothetical protein